ncbi:MAG: glutathione S-transferase [Alphaproteobacteria bacterium]|nr:glutathione S-transferase [Alphaproteobacteria bacterium]MCB9699473.1 glutathione S-transferase [Alphaproteobacteria bacterium]
MRPVLHYWDTPLGRGEQIRLWMAELGLTWDEVATPWRGEGWDALAPDIAWFGAVPALVVDGFSLVQSGVIVCWLAREHGRMPVDGRLAATVEALVWSAEDLRQAGGLAAHRGPDAVRDFLRDDWRGRFLPGLEAFLARSTSGWLVGDAPTPADTSFWDAIDQVLATVPGATLEGPVAEHRALVAALPRIAAYLASKGR